jgi:hypothetical protein
MKKEGFMPPSGFIRIENKILSTFAESILLRFEQEVVDGKFISVEEGINHELKIIDSQLNSDILHTERGVLEFVKGLYMRLKEGCEIEDIANEIELLAHKQYK